jgi:hypothetical protein
MENNSGNCIVCNKKILWADYYQHLIEHHKIEEIARSLSDGARNKALGLD